MQTLSLVCQCSYRLSSEEGKRKGKKGEGGEIVESANEKPLEMMTPAELEVIKEAKAAKVQAEKEAKTRKLEMEVAKAARERKKKRGGRRKK